MTFRAFAVLVAASLAVGPIGGCDARSAAVETIRPEPASASGVAMDGDDADPGEETSPRVDAPSDEVPRARPNETPGCAIDDPTPPIEVAVRRDGNPLDSLETVHQLGQVVTDADRCRVDACAVVDADVMAALVERMRPGLEARTTPTARSPHYMTTTLEVEWQDHRCSVEDSWDVAVIDADVARFRAAVDLLSARSRS